MLEMLGSFIVRRTLDLGHRCGRCIKPGSGIELRSEKELQIVRVLDEQRNFGRAASILNMTQPALSRALQRIERGIGVKLFERSKTHVAPTAQCQTALEHVNGLVT